jgi:hypothetical protein
MTIRALTALSVLSCVLATAASAATLHVANNGLDGADCGPKTAPCRSITRAIANAAPGDTIAVGPGRYGDLDRDGTLGEPNEEGPAAGTVLLVDKPVSVVSTSGAVWTIIDVAGFNRTGVRITAAGARFGKAKKGFTLFDSSGAGLAVEESATNVVVEGNLAVATGTGFFAGFDAANALLQGNVASANQAGFGLFANGTGVARGNLAVANDATGFSINSDGTKRCEGNVALGNGAFGFQAGLHEAVVLTGNVAAGNNQGVFAGNGDSVTVTGLAALANVEGGVHNQGTTAMTVSASNVVGNGAKTFSGRTNCGTIDEALPLTATNVFWGAATGPGADPADDACDVVSGVTTVAPFAAKAFKIKTKVPQP